MTWNFRLVKHTERSPRRVWYGVHEVFYNESGKLWTMTQDPVQIDGESAKDALAYLRMIQHDLKRLPVLDAQKARWAKASRNMRGNGIGKGGTFEEFVAKLDKKKKRS